MMVNLRRQDLCVMVILFGDTLVGRSMVLLREIHFVVIIDARFSLVMKPCTSAKISVKKKSDGAIPEREKFS